MWLFEEIVKEAISDIEPEKSYDYNKKPDAVLGGVPEDELENNEFKFEGERYYLDLGPGYGMHPIVGLAELRKNFDVLREASGYTNSKGEKEATAELVNYAARNGFFDVWIASDTVGNAISVDKHYSNKGIALEYIFGKERDNKSGSDIIGAELKAYAGSSPTVTLFGLAPYEILHYPDPQNDTNPIPKSNSQMQNVITSIKKKIDAAEQQTRTITTKDYTDYSFNCRSYAKVKMNTDKKSGKAKSESLNIYIQFYRYDAETKQEVPIDAIECIYSIDATQQILYQKVGKIKAKGEDENDDENAKKNLYQTISDKIQTIYSFSTVELAITGVPKGVIPGTDKAVHTVYAYNKLHIMTVDDVDSLMFNFIECINSGDIVISFKITKTLSFSTNFMIKNTVESYDRLYKTRKENEKPYFQNDNEKNLGSVDAAETLIIKNSDGSYSNIYDKWYESEPQVKARTKKAKASKARRKWNAEKKKKEEEQQKLAMQHGTADFEQDATVNTDNGVQPGEAEKLNNMVK